MISSAGVKQRLMTFNDCEENHVLVNKYTIKLVNKCQFNFLLNCNKTNNIGGVWGCEIRIIISGWLRVLKG